MRRIGSKKDEKRRRQRNQLLIGIILVVVLFGSVFGLATMNFNNPDNENTVKYNGYEFFNQGSYWYLNLGGKNYAFQYNPYQIQESFNLTSENLKYLNEYQGTPLYVNSFDNINAEGEIARTFSGFALRIQRACMDVNGTMNNENNETMNVSEINEKCPKELPLKDCSSNFIIIREIEEGGEQRIYQQENCVFIEGELENLIKLTDDYLFRIMGIK